MDKTKHVLTTDRVQVIDRIQNVKIGLRSSSGECVICQEEGETVEVVATVFYPGRDIYGRVTTIATTWTQQFCAYCLNQFFGGTQKEVERGYC